MLEQQIQSAKERFDKELGKEIEFSFQKRKIEAFLESELKLLANEIGTSIRDMIEDDEEHAINDLLNYADRLKKL